MKTIDELVDELAVRLNSGQTVKQKMIYTNDFGFSIQISFPYRKCRIAATLFYNTFCRT